MGAPRAEYELAHVLHGLLTSFSPTASLDYAGLAALVGSNMLIAALDLVDHDEVTKLVLPNGRALYQVAGSTTPYLITFGSPPYLSHCPCAAFAQSVIATGEQVACKHLLAALIADRLNRIIERPIDLNYVAALSTNFKVVTAPS